MPPRYHSRTIYLAVTMPPHIKPDYHGDATSVALVLRYVVNEKVSDDSTVRIVHGHTGIPTSIFEKPIEQWHRTRSICCVDGTTRSREKEGVGKAPDGTCRVPRTCVDQGDER